MKLSQYQLTETDVADFESITTTLGLNPSIQTIKKSNFENPIDSRDYKAPIVSEIPSVNNFSEYKIWMLKLVDKIEAFIGITSNSQQTKKEN